METPSNLRQLIEQGYAFPALLPEKNDFILSAAGIEYRRNAVQNKPLDARLNKMDLLDLSKLDTLKGYSVPVIAHDYSAKTPLMWNSLYESLGLNLRNIMLVADPANIKIIFDAFRKDPKYLGGGLGVGFKERGVQELDRSIPSDLKAANIAVREGNYLVGYNTDAQGFVGSLDEALKRIGKDIEGGNFVLLGAGGVAQEVARFLARKNAKFIAILNRTKAKAVALAYGLNSEFERDLAIGAGEDIIRGYALNSYTRPDAIINLTDKGADGPLVEFAALHDTSRLGDNISTSRTIMRELKRLNSSVVIADIVLPKSGRSISLRIAENEGLTNLLDGVPMVINQAAPAYCLVQSAHPELHEKKVTEEEALAVFKNVAKKV